MNSKIEQAKLNAISARHLHQNGLFRYGLLNNIFLILTVIVPILFIIAQYISKGTAYENVINIISLVLSIVLIAACVLSLILQVSDRIVTYKMGIKNNLYVANECDNVANASADELKWFFRYLSEIDNQDHTTFAKLDEKQRQAAYRQALKEFEPGNYTITCPICHASPWEYKEGDCQLCGNTPAKK